MVRQIYQHDTISQSGRHDPRRLIQQDGRRYGGAESFDGVVTTHTYNQMWALVTTVAGTETI